VIFGGRLTGVLMQVLGQWGLGTSPALVKTPQIILGAAGGKRPSGEATSVKVVLSEGVSVSCLHVFALVSGTASVRYDQLKGSLNKETAMLKRIAGDKWK